jgi:hypothetical protein
VALDIYMSAQDGSPDPTTLRRALLERKRMGGAGPCWPVHHHCSLCCSPPRSRLCASPSPRHGFSANLEHRKKFSKFDDAILSLAVAEMSRRAPAELVPLCVLLAQTAEVTVAPPGRDSWFDQPLAGPIPAAVSLWLCSHKLAAGRERLRLIRRRPRCEPFRSTHVLLWGMGPFK